MSALYCRFKVYARWLGGQRELDGRLAPRQLGGRGGCGWHVEQHRLPGKRLLLGTGQQWRLGTEPTGEEAQQQGVSLLVKETLENRIDDS